MSLSLALCFPAPHPLFVSPPAAGLYYLAELIEEYTVATSRIIKYMIMVSECHRPSNLKSIRQWNVATTTPVSCVNVSSSRQLSWRVCTSLKASQCWWWESASSPTWCTSACCRRSRTYCWAPRTSSSPVVNMTDAGLRFFLLSTARIDAFLVLMLK